MESESETESTDGSSSHDDGYHKRRVRKSKVSSHVSGMSNFFFFRILAVLLINLFVKYC